MVYHLIAYTSTSSIIDYVCGEAFFSIYRYMSMLVLFSNVERMVHGMDVFLGHQSKGPNLFQDTNYMVRQHLFSEHRSLQK